MTAPDPYPTAFLVLLTVSVVAGLGVAWWLGRGGPDG